MLALLFALRRESEPFLRKRRDLTGWRGAPMPAWRGPGVVVAETGVGPEHATRTVQWVFDHAAPTRVVMAGFAGALADGWPVGQVVAAGEVIDPFWNVVPCGRPGPRLLTWTRIVGDPAEKRALGDRYGAVAVDMESATVAALCRDAGVPFAAVRAISDAADDTLSPDLRALMASGRVRPERVALALAKRPTLAAELLRLERATRLAANRLAAWLVEREMDD